MTEDDGMNSEMAEDEARTALVRVSQLFRDNADFTLKELQSLENYELIPEPVRQTLEGLSPPERHLLNRILNTLTENNLYIEEPGFGPIGY